MTITPEQAREGMTWKWRRESRQEGDTPNREEVADGE